MALINSAKAEFRLASFLADKYSISLGEAVPPRL
jgi:hypothetical protein